MSDKIHKTDTEWREQLTPEQYQVCRHQGTERAFTGRYHDHRGTGVYRCVCCGAEPFSSETTNRSTNSIGAEAQRDGNER